MSEPTILVVDDDAFFRTFCSEVLRGAGYAVQTADSGREALEACSREPISLILADIYMPELTGLALLESVKAQNPSVDVIIMTGYASIDTAVQALKRGAADYLRKPFAAEELTAVVEATLAQRRLYRENVHLKRQLQLYEVSRAFASMDDPNRVLDLGLEALLHASGCRRGLCLCSHSELQFMSLMHQRGMEPETAVSAREAFVTRGLRHLRGLDRVQVLGKARLSRILDSDEEAREAMLVPLRHRQTLEGAFLLLRDREGGRFTSEDEGHVRFLGLQLEISYESARRVQDARQLAYVDSLTDLYNARYLDSTLDKSIAEAERLRSTFSVLFLDLDYFKQVNDAYGHLTGGKVLIEVSRILMANVRDEDTVIRYGGDEFTVVLPHTSSLGAREVAERIRRAIKEHPFLGREGHAIRLTASIGVATYPDDAKSREELIDQADRAMYRGKEATRDAVYAARSR